MNIFILSIYDCSFFSIMNKYNIFYANLKPNGQVIRS